MRYVRQQVVTTTVTDEEIKDDQIQRDLLTKISQASADIMIEYRDERTGHIRSYERVRIIGIKNDTIDIRAFQKQGLMVTNGIKMKDILSVKLVTSKHNIVISGEKTSRFDFLDIVDEGKNGIQ